MTIWTEVQQILADAVFDEELMDPVPMVLSPATQSFDDVTNTFTTVTEDSIDCKGHVSMFSQRDIDGTRIRNTDLEVIFQPTEPTASVDLTKAWKMTLEGTTYDVVGAVRKIQGGSTALCYKAQIR